MYKVLIIEDTADTGSFLARYLDEANLRRLTCADYNGGVYHTEYGPHHPSEFEPAAGQLRHLRAGLRLRGGLIMPEPEFVSSGSIRALQNAAQTPSPRMRARYLTRILEDFGSLEEMILVLDLALDEHREAGDLEAAGGTDQVTPDSALRDFRREPRRVLKTLTGFRILEVFHERMPIIVTTYARNPLVGQLCLINGAFAVVVKPIPGTLANRFDWETACGIMTHTLENAARRKDGALEVVVAHYAMTIASEVMKAAMASSFRRLRRQTNTTGTEAESSG